MKPQSILRDRLVQPISERLEDRLVAATYRCLEFEVDYESQLKDPELYIGGELHLSFENGLLVVSWEENAGWPERFSLCVSTESLFRRDARLTPWKASDLPPWCDCVSHTLARATVFAAATTPHALALWFGRCVAVVGVGRETRFGDGDDLLVRDERGLSDVKSWDIMWDSGWLPI